MPHTPGYQPVMQTSDIFSKYFYQSIKSRIEFVKNYIEDVKNDQNIVKIIQHKSGKLNLSLTSRKF